MRIRRVVTGRNELGKSVVLSDGHSPREVVLQHTPGFVSSPLWRSEGSPELGRPFVDPMAIECSLLAPAGGVVFLVITFPPDSVMAAAEFDPVKAGAEHAAASPGLIDTFEPDNPGMHTTPTVDFATVVRGTIVLELDDGHTVTLNQGDTVVQQGARHAWRNPGAEPATVSFVMVGSQTA